MYRGVRLPSVIRRLSQLTLCALATVNFGCTHPKTSSANGEVPQPLPTFDVPTEFSKVTMPPYTVEAPDILRIDATRMIPLPPYRIEPLDTLYLYAPGAPEQAPINGLYPVDPDGTINLGPTYGGQFNVVDLTAPELEKKLAVHLKKFLKDSTIAISLAQSKSVQYIRGEHLVNPDGTVRLGTYGSVYVAGMTLPQIKSAIETHLSKYLYKPEVSIDIGAYNSKFYYVITDFAGNGEQVVKLPITGNETVLDAVSNIGGLSAVSSTKIWIARPAPAQYNQDQILPVDWKGITRRGHSRTNYQVFPGDRVFVMAQPLAKLDTKLARTLNPIERVFGASLLGFSTVKTLQTGSLFGGNGNNR